MLRIINHCWAKDVPIYAQMTRAQLLSLLQFRPKIPVSYTLVYSKEDPNTECLLDEFGKEFRGSLDLEGLCLDPQDLWRRSIGRNLAAKSDTKSDLFWFTDSDHLFGPRCIDTLFSEWKELHEPEFLWPRFCLVNDDKDVVDCILDKNQNVRISDFGLDNFSSKKNPRAIGGIQIASQEFIKQYGYLDWSDKWRRPANTPFPDFRDDVVFREHALKYGDYACIELPNLFRLRHTTVGYGGK